MKFVSILAKLKFRFDLGQSFLTILNFAFIVLAASDKITTLVHLPAKILIPILVPLAILSVLLLGYLLDKMQFLQSYQEETNRRNEMLKSIHDKIK